LRNKEEKTINFFSNVYGSKEDINMSSVQLLNERREEPLEPTCFPMILFACHNIRNSILPKVSSLVLKNANESRSARDEFS
jgi:hypothetical protein